MIFLGVVAPHGLARRLSAWKKELEQQVEELNCAAEYEEEEHILEVELPRVEQLLRILDRTQPLTTSAGGFAVHALAMACLQVAQVVGDVELMERLEVLQQNTARYDVA